MHKTAKDPSTSKEGFFIGLSEVAHESRLLGIHTYP